MNQNGGIEEVEEQDVAEEPTREQMTETEYEPSSEELQDDTISVVHKSVATT